MQKLPDNRVRVKVNNGGSGKRSSGVKALFRCFVALILVSSMFVFATRLMKYNELKREKEALKEQIEKEEQEIDKLNRDIAAPMDDEYIIRVAREKLNLYFPDETIFYGGSK